MSRILLSLTLLVFLGTVIPSPETGSLHAHRGKRGVSSKSSAPKKSKTGANRTQRRYTLRGNPEATRSIAFELLATKLPDLAALVGIESESASETELTPEERAASTPSATEATGTQSTAATVPATSQPGVAHGTNLTGVRSITAYVDAELTEEEDPDAITNDDLALLEELPTDINTFYKDFATYMASLNGESTITDNGVDKVRVMQTIVDWAGTRYLFGGMGRRGIDCSAYTGTLYRSIDFKLPRTAAAQWEVGQPVATEDLQFGDLVFFNTRSAVYVSHVGMYLGNGYFTHASSRNGVTVSSLNSDYYSSHLIGARRYDVNAVIAANAESAME